MWPDTTTNTCPDRRPAASRGAPDRVPAESVDPDPAADRVDRSVTEHRAELTRKTATLRQAEAATAAAPERYDERWGSRR